MPIAKKTGLTICKSIQKKGKADLGTKWLSVKKRKSKKCRMLKIYKKDRNLSLKWKYLLDFQMKTQHLYALFGTDVFMQRLFIYSINKNTIVISLTISTFVTI